MRDLLEVLIITTDRRESADGDMSNSFPATLPGVRTINDLSIALDDAKVRGWLEVLDSEGRAGFYNVERISAVVPVLEGEDR